MICPNVNCKKKLLVPVVKSHNEGNDNIDNLPHSHLECPFCGTNFNFWHCDVKRLKQAFGQSYEMYL